MHLALAAGGLLVGENPDIGGNTCVVEDVVGQLDDGIHQIILYHIATDIALATACIARKQTGAVVNRGNARALWLLLKWLHLIDHFEHEQQLTIGGARRTVALQTDLQSLLTGVRIWNPAASSHDRSSPYPSSTTCHRAD